MIAPNPAPAHRPRHAGPAALVRACAWLALATTGACAILRPLQVPLAVVDDPAEPGRRAEVLLVLLPGSQDDPHDLVREGFVQSVRDRRLGVDVRLVDAYPAYYLRDLAIVDRLHRDVLMPARAAGYREIWIAGISIGGFGALLAAQHPIAPGHAETSPVPLAGLILLAPYLGPPSLFDEVDAAGGLRAWAARAARDEDREQTFEGVARFERRFLRWLAGFDAAAGARTAPPAGSTPDVSTPDELTPNELTLDDLTPDDLTRPRPQVFLGFGRDDRFAASNARLGEVLAPAQVFVEPGGHDWPAWIALWRRILDRITWPTR